jgi:hypothetical protein
MVETFKRLGAVAPSATTNTQLYQCPVDKSSVLDGIVVANRGSSGTFRIAHVDGAIGDLATSDWAYYDVTLAANSSLDGVLKGRAMGAGDTIVVYASSGDFSFTVGGVEISDTVVAADSCVNKPSTITLTAAEVTNTIIDNYGQSAPMTLTLPAAAAGYNFVMSISTTGNAVHIKAGASDKIYLDGTALDDADKVSLVTPAVGNWASFFTFRSGASTYDWVCNAVNGTWTDGGA